MTERRFWMVWSPEGAGPTKMHATHEAAASEARRLSMQRWGRTFYVLVAEKGICYEPRPPTREWGLY
jgi:hypothetical protein